MQGADTHQSADPRVLKLVAFIVFIDMLGMGLVQPVLPNLIMELSQSSLERSAQISGYFLLAYALMQFSCAPLMGALSDRYGRRPILLATLFALALNYFLMALAPTLALIFIGRLISGILGASWAAANSCFADCVNAKDRARAFGLLAAAGAAGYVLGPAIGGLTGEVHTRLPFFIAGALALTGAGFGFFWLPETLALSQRRKIERARISPFGALRNVAQTPVLRQCLLIIFFLQLSAQAHLSIWAFYGAEKFGWTPLIAGITASVYGLLLAAVQSSLTGRVVTQFGAAKAAQFSLLFAIPSYLILAFAPSTAFVLVAIVFGCLTGIAFPALQSKMTGLVAPESQGEMQGAIVSTLGLTAIIGPMLMTHLFSHFADHQGVYFPGTPFIVSTIFIAIANILLWQLRNGQRLVEAV